MKRIPWTMFWLVLSVFLLVGAAGRADDDATNSNTQVTVTPSLTYITVKGDKQRFREDTWMNDYWSGGAAEATLHQVLGKDTTLDFSGRGLFNQDDYKLQLEIVKKDVGFIRGGYTENRHDFDDVGGFFKGFTPHGFDSHHNLVLRHGDIFFEAGLRLPDLPKLTIGYERQSTDGQKSLLEWGGVTQGGATRNIFPSHEDIDEFTHIIKAEAAYDVGSVHLADQFRFEHFHSDITRYDGSVNLDTSSSQSVTVHEDYRHDEFFNTFHMDQHLNEKVYWSLGYMFTTLKGGGDMALSTEPFSTPTDKNWFAQAIDVDLNSHVVNLNAMVGPFAGLYLYGGLQGEKTSGNGLTDAVLEEIAFGGVTNSPQALLRSSTDTDSLEETLGARYTKLPFTTLYAEGKWTEQQIDLGQSEDGGPDAFVNSTDSDIFRQDYSIGFNTAPLPRVTLAGRYRRSIYQNDYNHTVDTIAGYPGFITAQDFTTDEVMSKLTVRPCSRFTVSLEYQLVATDFNTTTEAVPPLVPSGSVQSGNFDAAIYSISATVTPISRMYLTGYFSFQDTRTATFDNGTPTVVTYRGNVYTVIGTAGYALDKKTDLTVEYTYSRTDDGQSNAADGLPLGVENQRHGLLVGISRHIKENILARLRYGYYELNDPGNGGIDNYRAHLFSGSVTCRF